MRTHPARNIRISPSRTKYMHSNPAGRRATFGNAWLATTLLLAMSLPAFTQDARDEWPEGSAMHSAYVEAERLQAGRAELEQAHADLLDAIGGNPADPPPLARGLASQHAHWLDYVRADCELAGTLTGAGGAWPSVHGLSCQIESIFERLEVVRGATACLRQLSPDAYRFEQFECLEKMVAWSMEGN